MLRNWRLLLVASCGWAAACASSSNESSELGSASQALSCTGASPWSARPYTAGERATHGAKLFECKPFPFTGWCGQREPEIGLGWQDAWTQLGACDATTGAGGSGGTGGAGGTGGSAGTAGTGGTGGSTGGSAGTGGSGGVAGYVCPAPGTTCVRPNCACASTAIPGGIARTSTPQFILLTFDDAVNGPSRDLEARLLKKADGTPLHKNRNHTCTIPANLFVSTNFTDFHILQEYTAQGHEIADHTMTHTTGDTTTLATWLAEIRGARTTYANLGVLSKSNIVGFRAPFLSVNPAMFDALNSSASGEPKFLYDSSIGEGFGRLSTSRSAFIWPYTFDVPGAQQCFVGTCPTQPVRGLWEIPLWNWYNDQNVLVSGMDPQGTQAELLAMFKGTFNARYNGNRAPMGFYIHPAWSSSDEHVAAFNEFAEWALAQSNVWFVTNRQLLAWVSNPVAATTSSNFAPCPVKPPGTTEVCDGWDNDNDGLVDEGVTRSCSHNEGTFSTCASSCPATYPKP